MSLSLPIYSPHPISSSLCSPIPSLSVHSSFLYFYPPQFSHGHTPSFVLCHYRHTHRPNFTFASIKVPRRGVSRCSSYSSFGRGGGEECDNGNEEEDDEEKDCGEEEEAEETFGSLLLPERWDVLGLGQAMVISFFFLRVLGGKCWGLALIMM